MIMEPKKNKKAEIDRGVLFSAGLVLALAATLVAFEWKTTPERINFSGNRSFETEQDIEIPPTFPEKQKPPTPAQVVEAFQIVENTFQTNFDLHGFISEPGPEDLFELGPANFLTPPVPEEEAEPIIFAEQMPGFPGGQAALLMFIQRSLKYPVIAQENGIQGKVFVRFVIDKQGNVTNVELVRGVDPSLDHEALRVIKSLPRWEPGRQQGKAVRVLYTVPIAFRLQ